MRPTGYHWNEQEKCETLVPGRAHAARVYKSYGEREKVPRPILPDKRVSMAKSHVFKSHQVEFDHFGQKWQKWHFVEGRGDFRSFSKSCKTYIGVQNWDRSNQHDFVKATSLSQTVRFANRDTFWKSETTLCRTRTSTVREFRNIWESNPTSNQRSILVTDLLPSNRVLPWNRRVAFEPALVGTFVKQCAVWYV